MHRRNDNSSVPDVVVSDDELQRYLEGDVSVARQEEIEAALAHDSPLEQRLRKALALRAALSTLPENLAHVDLWQRVQQGVAKQPAPHRTTPPAWSWIGKATGAVALCAAGFLLWFGDNTAPPSTPEFRAKSTAAEPFPFTGFDVYRLEKTSAVPVRISSSDAQGNDPAHIASGDALLFSYSNGGKAPFGYLLLFSVDSAGVVHWYYPELTSRDRQAASIAVHGDVSVPLPQAIRVDHAPGSLDLFAVFSRTPWTTADVERRVQATQNPHLLPAELARSSNDDDNTDAVFVAHKKVTVMPATLHAGDGSAARVDGTSKTNGSR
jgi:hypothetical protein